MHPGIVGALALVGTAGAIYFGSGYLNDYFAARNADMAVETAEQTEDTDGAPSNLVGDVTEAPAEATQTEIADTTASDGDVMADMAEEVAETATEEMAALTDGVADAASDMANTVPETAEETLERVLEAAPGSTTEVGEQEATPEPGTSPVLDIVRIEPTGETVIAGNAPEGERVGLLYNNELIADTDVDAGGDFVLVPDEPIPSGEGTMEIVVIDEAGNTVIPSQEQVAVVLPEDGSADGFLVGVLRPNEPVDIIERQAPVVRPEVEVAARVEPASPAETTPLETPTTDAAETSASIEVAEETVLAPDVEIAARVEPTQRLDTDQPVTAEAFVIVDAIELEGRDMWIAGGALPGTVIRLYQDNVFLGEVITGEEGRYLFEGTLLDAEGDVTVRADALVTGSADVIARAEVPFEVPLSSAQLATAALEQVEDEVASIEEDVVEVAQAAQEQVAEVVQEQAADVAETASEAVTGIAETVQEQTATAVEAASEIANSAADTAAGAVEVVQEGVAAAVGTVTEVAETASEQIDDVAETVSETTEVVTEDVSQAANIEAPQVEIAATTTPSTPPTEALAQALEDVAVATATETDAPTAEIVAEVAATTAETEAPSAEVVAEVAAPAAETQAPAAEAVAEVAAATTETEARAPEVVAEVAATAEETQAPAAEVIAEVAATTAGTQALAAEIAPEVAATITETEVPAAEGTAEVPASTAQADATPAPAAEAAAAATPAASTSATRPERISVLDTGQVIIRRGDNLWRLSRRVYGQGIRYTSIYDANRDQIGRPELIFPGQVFTLPTPQEEWGAVPGLEALDSDQIPGDR